MVMEVHECILRDQKVSLNNEVKCGKAPNIDNITFVILLIGLLSCITEPPTSPPLVTFAQCRRGGSARGKCRTPLSEHLSWGVF